MLVDILRRKQLNAFSLSFIDIMACGLGAVALMFVFVKEATFSPLNESFENEILPIELEIESINEDINFKEKEILNINNEIQMTERSAKNSKQKIEVANNVIENLINQNNELSASLKNINKKSETKYKPVKKSYISGCNVTGKKIILLLDSSKSMLHKDLVEIIRLSVEEDSIKKNTEKWKKAKDILRWLSFNLPSDAKVLIAKFNTELIIYPDTKDWTDANNTLEIEKQILFLLNEAPNKGTNLQKSIEQLKNWNDADSIYLITDGLPTLAKKSNSQSRLNRCLEKDTVSSECRQLFFDKFVESYSDIFPNTKFNTILLPMIGDPIATFKYSVFSKENDGCFLTSSDDWPL